MKLKKIVLILTSVVVMCGSLRAQDTSAPAHSNPINNSFQIGIGVALDIGAAPGMQPAGLPAISSPTFIPYLPLTFLIPMRISGFKIEPEFGFFSFSYNVQPSKDSTGKSFSSTEDFTANSIRLGTGLYYTMPLTGNVIAYIGPRLGIITHSVTEDIHPPIQDSAFEKSREITSSRIDFFAGLTMGGEYYFSRAFSLSAEVGIEYVNLGTETTTQTPAVSETESGTTGHSIITKESIVARIYF